MWLKVLNLLFIQLFLVQTFAFAAHKKYLSGNQLQEIVSALKQMDKDAQKRLYLTVLPFIHKEDKNIIDEKFFFETIKNLSVDGNNLVLNVGSEIRTIKSIDLQAWTAELDGRTIHVKKSVKEQMGQFFDPGHSSSFLNHIIPSAYAQEKLPVPRKLLVMALMVAGTVVVLCAVGAGLWGWVKADKNAHTQPIQEIQALKLEEVLSNDCKEQKGIVKRDRLGEKLNQSSEFVKMIKDKIAMLNETKAEAAKVKMTLKEVEWIDKSKSCYEEVIELIELKSEGVQDDGRSPKDIRVRTRTKGDEKGASKQ